MRDAKEGTTVHAKPLSVLNFAPPSVAALSLLLCLRNTYRFDEFGRRTNFTLDVVEITPESRVVKDMQYTTELYDHSGKSVW